MSRKQFELSQAWYFAHGSIDEAGAYQAIQIPHDWAVEAPYKRNMDQGEPQGFFDRWGVGWYRCVFNQEAVESDRVYLLEFGAVYENSTVSMNGQAVGGHHYGYSPFRVDITEALRPGENELIVRVDNTQTPVDRWYSGAGIYRAVQFLDLPKQHLDPWDVVVRYNLTDIQSSVSLQSGAAASLILAVDAGISADVVAELYDGDQLVASQQGLQNIEITVDSVKLWSADAPHLYELRLHLLAADGSIADSIDQKIGFREIEITAEKGLLVNGIPTKLNGVCIHQDTGISGVASSAELWRVRLEKLRAMGCNALRLSHHLFPAFILDMADEMGFYVYEESFDKWTAGLYGRYFEEDWVYDLEVMVKRDRNRPSIIIWGVGNEVEHQGQDSMIAILKQLVSRIKDLDDRPVSYAMNPHFKRRRDVDMSQITDIQKFVDEEDEAEIYDNAERIRRIGLIAEQVDILSCNYMEQWYEMIHEALPEIPILGSETYQYFRGHMDQMQHFSEEIPALAVQDKDYVLGCMIWTAYDYLGESMGWPAKGWGGALIRTNGEERPSYHILKSYWTAEPMVYFAVMDYSQMDEGVKEHWDIPMYAHHWQFNQYHKTVVPYMIATNCDYVELWLNNKPFYPARPSDSANGVIHGYLPCHMGRIEVRGFYDGQAEPVAVQVVETADVASELRFDETEIRIDCDGVVDKLLTVRAVDRAGRVNYNEEATVHFAIEGDAEIVGVDNGNIMRNEPFTGQTIHLYHGVASVQIRVRADSGRVVVQAKSPGMKLGRAIIIVNELE